MADTSNLFQDFAFSPAEGLRSRSYSPSEPESEDAIRDQIQGIADQLRDHLNTLQEKLASKTAGASGAHHIASAPIPNVSGETVAQQLYDLKQQLDHTALGDIPSGGISTDKLADHAVSSEKLADGSVSEQKLADGAVSTGKIAAGAVGLAQLADGCITSAKLADGAGTLTHRIQLTQSGNWTAPATALYKITLFGGGGGGGAGMYLYNSSWSTPYHHFSGAGGSAAVPVSGQFMLPAGAQCQFIIAAGGTGRTTNSYTVSSTTPAFTFVDAEATAGGESTFSYGSTVLLQTEPSSRISGGAYAHSSKKYVSGSVDIYAGSSGAGYTVGTQSNSQSSSTIDTSTTLPGASSCGGGEGAAYSHTQTSAGMPAAGGDAPIYGTGGGGGCMLFGITESAAAAIVSAGGNGGDGAAIIEWID